MKGKMWSNVLVCGAFSMNGLLGGANAYGQGTAGDQNFGLRPSYQECIDDSGGVTAKLLNCNGDEMKFQDRRLNDAYKTLTQSLPPKEELLLREDERKWIAYRDSYCAPDANGGTATDVDTSECKVEEAAKRANALEARMHK